MDEEEKKLETEKVIKNNEENDEGDDIDFDKIEDFPNTTINFTKN